MTIPRVTRAPLAILLLAALSAGPMPALAAEEILFGPTQYVRTAGPPNQFSETIALPPTLTAPFRLHVQNGTSDGNHRVSSATITLNGTQVVGPADFTQQVAAFDKAVTLQPSNTLQVRLASKPGSLLLLTLVGTVPPPMLTSLAPPSLPLTAGSTGILTVTLSTVRTTPTIVALQSSDPSIATVPAAVPVPPNASAAAVPVTAVASGTATIIASLNGSSLQSTVTVTPSGPTLTSLTPGTLQVTQGASGILTLTLSATQATDTEVPLATSNAAAVGLPPHGECQHFRRPIEPGRGRLRGGPRHGHRERLAQREQRPEPGHRGGAPPHRGEHGAVDAAPDRGEQRDPHGHPERQSAHDHRGGSEHE
jgi:hypothetical protein